MKLQQIHRDLEHLHDQGKMKNSVEDLLKIPDKKIEQAMITTNLKQKL